MFFLFFAAQLHVVFRASLLARVRMGGHVDVVDVGNALPHRRVEPDRVRHAVHGRRVQRPPLGELHLRGKKEGREAV